MKLLYKLERKYGKYAIRNLMYYIIILQVAGIFLYQVAPSFVVNYLELDIDAVLHGQIWRLFTFVITGYIGDISGFNIILIAIELYLYYYISRSLENAWGSFRFNLYYLAGILFNIVAALLIYFVFADLFGFSFPYYPFGITYINRSLFLAFAATFPEMELLYMFLIPIKIKYLGIFYGAYILYDVVSNILDKNYIIAIAIIVAMANFIIFFLCTRNMKRISPKQRKRKIRYQKEVHSETGKPRHKCAVCGRTELDDESLEFRFCSKCDGNYEYCMEHLFTHEHVRKK